MVTLISKLAISTSNCNLKGIGDCGNFSWGKVMHPQLLEGLKEESQVEDSGKGEGVGVCSLIRNTRGVEGRVGAPGLGLGKVTSLIHLLKPASNQPQSG